MHDFSGMADAGGMGYPPSPLIGPWPRVFGCGAGVFNDIVSARAREIFEYIAPKYGITVEEWNHDMDHVHVLFRAQPKSELSKFINPRSKSYNFLVRRTSGIPNQGGKNVTYQAFEDGSGSNDSAGAPVDGSPGGICSRNH